MTDVAGEIAMTGSLKQFKAAGGGCLVDNSTYGMNRNIKFLKKLSQDTGVHIIAGTGSLNNNFSIYSGNVSDDYKFQVTTWQRTKSKGF